MRGTLLLSFACTVLGLTGVAVGQRAIPAAEPSSSLMARAVNEPAAESIATQEGASAADAEPGSISLFAIETPEPREFQRHDLVEIIIRETTRVQRKNESELEKQWDLNGKVTAFPEFRLEDLVQLKLRAGTGQDLPSVGIDMDKTFEAEGRKKEQEDITARLTAEVIEVLPNGNLILEARTFIKTDKEESTLKVTGICRSDDVSPANTVLSTQIHDLKVMRETEGDLKDNARKGLITSVFDLLFHF